MGIDMHSEIKTFHGGQIFIELTGHNIGLVAG